MVKRLTLFPFLLLLSLSQLALATEFTATVDRKQIGEQDTLTLKLRINEQAVFSKPALQPLEKDFRIQGQQRSQQFRSVNGKTESFTEWSIGLLPRQTGTLTIPALEYKGTTSQPIEIEVLPPSAQAQQQASEDFFFETEVTPNSESLVQSQLLYKEKLYYASNHNDANLSELVINNAHVQALEGVKNYSTVINGRRFGVYERNYAIFPETTGELIIPSQRFQASVPNAYDRWSRGQSVNVSSQPTLIDIHPIPAEYPADAAWLPSTELSISETFSQDPSQWQAGEAVTRTIKIQARGITGNQLPDIALPAIKHLRYYPDQAKQDETITDSGVMGYSEQSMAIVASSGGEFTLPEVRIPWWNTETNQLEYAVLPAHNIRVAGEVAPTEPTAATSSPSESESNDTSDANNSTHSRTKADNNDGTSWQLKLLFLLLALSVLVNIALLVARKKHPRRVSTTANEQTDSSNDLHKSHWQAFNQACNNNQPAEMRQHLLAWAAAGGLHDTPLKLNSLTALSQQVSNPALANALLELDSLLYSNKDNAAFNGQTLKSLLQEEKKRTYKIEDNNSLYPTT